MADIWSTIAPRGVAAGHVDDRGYGSGAAAALTVEYRRRAVRFVAGSARDAGDAALILEALGLEPVEGRDGTEKVGMSTCISSQGEYSEHTPGPQGDERFICQVCSVFDEDAALRRIAELESALDEPERPAVVDERPGKQPCPDGFHWVGQPFTSCDRCGLPAWEHAGWAEPPKDAGPFDTRPFALTPFKPGEADRVRAKWEVPGDATE